MDEAFKLSWQARLAKSNINILNITRINPVAMDVFYEFMYHPHPHQTKWCKTWLEIYQSDTNDIITGDVIEYYLSKQVLALRKELENN